MLCLFSGEVLFEVGDLVLELCEGVSEGMGEMVVIEVGCGFLIC